jgi:hypothetical protein
MTAFLKACWSKRWVRVWTWVVAALITVFVLFYQWVNWTGARAWRSAQEVLAREGESLDFRAIVPESAPEAQNFCAIAALSDFALAVDGQMDKGEPAAKRNLLQSAGLPTGDKQGLLTSRPALALGPSFGKPTDLKAWADWLRKEGSLVLPPDSGNAARDILAGLSKHDSVIAQLAAALNRPDAQWTPGWKHRELPEIIFSISLPHYRPAKEFVPMLFLRALAAAHAGEPAKAHESLLIAMKFIRASLNDPFLIGNILAMSQTQQACHVAWELCRVHCGSADDFLKLQRELSQLDFQAALLCAFRAELAGGAGAVMIMKRQHDARLLAIIAGIEDSKGPSSLERFLVSAIPAGWFDKNAATVLGLGLENIIKPLRHGGLKALVENTGFEEELKRRKGKLQLDSIMACLFYPAVMHVGWRGVHAQSQVNQAIIACELERAFLAHQSYPETLETSQKGSDGKALPLDLLSAKPMGYRKTSDGRYALWCVGLDGRDDGGKRVLDEEQPEKTKFQYPGHTGDWVWDFPEANGR